MGQRDLRTNPDALADAEPARIGRYAVNGTTLYAEVRGSGPAVLLIHAGAEDAEGWRPIAERLSGFTVVTYDRRGTLRSDRNDWPGGGSVQHADDAAALLETLDLDHPLVLGYSSSGSIALQLALRHSELVRRALVYEPGYLLLLPDPKNIHRTLTEAASQHLADNPGDWAGAYVAVMRALAPESENPQTWPVRQRNRGRGTTSGKSGTPRRSFGTTSRFLPRSSSTRPSWHPPQPSSDSPSGPRHDRSFGRSRRT